MRKIFVFIALALVFCLIGASAQPYQVEKASKVKANGRDVIPGQILDNNTNIKIDDNGYLLFLDTQNKKRYYINVKCKNKVKNLIQRAKSPMKVTQSYLESLFLEKQDKDKYASAGSVNRGEEEEAQLSEFALMDFTRGEELPDSVPEPIGINVLTSTEDTIFLYYIIP